MNIKYESLLCYALHCFALALHRNESQCFRLCLYETLETNSIIETVERKELHLSYVRQSLYLAH